MADESFRSADYRIILLGASNLTLGLPRLVASLRAELPGIVEIVAAAGHGRSYIGWSYVVHRGLPGLRDCSLWESIEKRPPAKRTLAMFTDLGCDLFYGAKPQQIVDAVGECISRLRQISDKTIFVRPPLIPLSGVGTGRYVLVKNIFFPGPTIPWAIMKEYIHDVDTAVQQIAAASEICSVTPKAEWYGFDPIHIKTKFRDAAWSEIIESWELEPSPNLSCPTLVEALHIWTRKAAEQSLWRVIRRQSAQPVIRWSDGSSLSLF